VRAEVGAQRALKAIKDSKPALNPDGKKATYKLKEPLPNGSKTIGFVKVEKYWYIHD